MSDVPDIVNVVAICYVWLIDVIYPFFVIILSSRMWLPLFLQMFSFTAPRLFCFLSFLHFHSSPHLDDLIPRTRFEAWRLNPLPLSIYSRSARCWKTIATGDTSHLALTDIASRISFRKLFSWKNISHFARYISCWWQCVEIAFKNPMTSRYDSCWRTNHRRNIW